MDCSWRDFVKILDNISGQMMNLKINWTLICNLQRFGANPNKMWTITYSNLVSSTLNFDESFDRLCALCDFLCRVI